MKNYRMANIFRIPIKNKWYSTDMGKGITKCGINYFSPLDGQMHSAVGVSKCHPKDTFNLTLGERIAESRAKMEMYIKYAFKLQKKVNEAIERTLAIRDKEYNHYLKLIHESKGENNKISSREKG